MFIDSQSALDLIENRQGIPSIIREIWEDAGKLRDYRTPVILLWVLGHKDVEGNEKVDQAVKRVAEGGKNADLITLILYLREQVIRRKVR